MGGGTGAPEFSAPYELLNDPRMQGAIGLFSTPGYSSERWTVFRATGLHAVPHADRTDRVAEEADRPVAVVVEQVTGQGLGAVQVLGRGGVGTLDEWRGHIVPRLTEEIKRRKG